MQIVSEPGQQVCSERAMSNTAPECLPPVCCHRDCDYFLFGSICKPISPSLHQGPRNHRGIRGPQF